MFSLLNLYRMKFYFIYLLLLVFAVSCSSTPKDTLPPVASEAPKSTTDQVDPTPVPPTSTPVPPTATPVPPTSTPVPPTATPVPPTATPVPPTATPVPPTATPVPPTATPVPPTATPMPPTATPLPTADDTAVPVEISTYSVKNAFKIDISGDAEFEDAGWTGDVADINQGFLSISKGEITAIMIWSPDEGLDNVSLVKNMFDLLDFNLPENQSMESISEGELTTQNIAGNFGGYKVVEGQNTAEIGLIGAWICTKNSTTYSIAVKGKDESLVQIRFDEFISGFSCDN